MMGSIPDFLFNQCGFFWLFASESIFSSVSWSAIKTALPNHVTSFFVKDFSSVNSERWHQNLDWRAESELVTLITYSSELAAARQKQVFHRCQTRCPTSTWAPAGATVNKLFNRPLEWLKGHVCFCLRGGKSICVATKSNTMSILWACITQCASLRGEMRKPKMMDRRSDAHKSLD